MTNFVSDLRQVGGFLRVTPVSSTNKTDHQDITEILLKVALNTINLNLKLIYHVSYQITYYILLIHLVLNMHVPLNQARKEINLAKLYFKLQQ
jgi:hypothetical protein